MAEEAVPEVLLRDLVPGPVRLLGVGEDDARAAVELVVVAPDVEVALRRALGRLARGLEPGVLVGGVVDDELGDDAQAAAVRLDDEGAEVVERAVRRVHVLVVGDVVAVVAQRRRVERQQPDGVDAERLDVVEPLGQAAEVADAVAVGVGVGLDVQLVDDRVAVPVAGRRCRLVSGDCRAEVDLRFAFKGGPSSEEIVEVVLARHGARAAASRAPGCAGGRG